MNILFGRKPQLHVQFQVAVIRNTVLSKILWNIGLKYIISQIQFSSVNCAEELMDPQNIKSLTLSQSFTVVKMYNLRLLLPQMINS